MVLENEIWVFVGDGGGGRLLRCGLAPLDRCHVEEAASIEDRWEGHEHGRPSPRVERSGTGSAPQTHDREEQNNRFAREVATWLDRKVAEHGMADLVVFAPPRFLGVLRKVHGGRLSANVTEQEGDLTGLSTAALARHPAIQALVRKTRQDVP